MHRLIRLDTALTFYFLSALLAYNLHHRAFNKFQSKEIEMRRRMLHYMLDFTTPEQRALILLDLNTDFNLKGDE